MRSPTELAAEIATTTNPPAADSFGLRLNYWIGPLYSATDQMITSLQNKRVKEALKLRRRKGRDEQDHFLIDGIREIGQAMAAGIAIVEAFHCDDLSNVDTRAIVDELRQRTTPIVEVTRSVWDKIRYGSRRDGLLVMARYAPSAIRDLQPPGDGPEEGPIVILDGVEKPGNVGAVCRTASAAGAAAVIVCDPPTDLFNPNAIRASLGTVFHLPLAQATAAETLEWLRAHELPVFVARLDGTRSVYSVDLAQRCAIVLGSEAQGVGPTWLDPALQGIVLPMGGNVDSLNVANTAAVILYEALRQRTA
jgi:TrmH family RNA methyltransferase